MKTSENKSVDGRKLRYRKNTTESHKIEIEGRTLTLFRFTKQSSSKSPYWYARCYIDGKTKQISTKETDLGEAKETAVVWYFSMLIQKNPKQFKQFVRSYLND